MNRPYIVGPSFISVMPYNDIVQWTSVGAIHESPGFKMSKPQGRVFNPTGKPRLMGRVLCDKVFALVQASVGM